MPFAARGVRGDRVTVVELSGEVDIETAPRVRSALEEAIRSGLPVVVDLGEVTYMDSAGFGVLISTNLQARRVGTAVLLRAVPDRIRDLLGMLGLDTVLTIESGPPAGGRRQGWQPSPPPTGGGRPAPPPGDRSGTSRWPGYRRTRQS